MAEKEETGEADEEEVEEDGQGGGRGGAAKLSGCEDGGGAEVALLEKHGERRAGCWSMR